MQSSKKTAFADMIERHTKAKSKTKAIAFATLVAEGIYTEEGKIAPEYGGEMLSPEAVPEVK